MSKGKVYELLSKEIFETLLNQSEIKNINVQHDVTLKGITTTHQIDVYWEFEVGGITYKTIVQTKNWDKRIDKGELLKFSKVINDIPGQPKGIFVTPFGYQSGANEVAEANGIDLLILEQVDNTPIKIAQYGYARINLNKEPISMVGSSEKTITLTLEYIIYEPEIDKYEVVVDSSWLRENTTHNKKEIKSAILKRQFPKFKPAELQFYDDKGDLIFAFENVYKPFLEQLRKEKKESGRVIHSFNSPAFIKVANFHLQFIKIVSISANVFIKKSELKKIYMRLPDIVQFVLRNIHKNKIDTIGKKKK